MDLASASHELYGRVPGDFTAARDELASDARKAGQPELAASLKKLRKPSVGAWLANLLVRERSPDVDRLISLGEDLRRPESDVAGDDIRRVSKERGNIVSTLVRTAGSLAAGLSQSVSTAALEELETTLDAAFADPQAAAELRRGQLTRGLHYSGLGFGGLPRTGARSDAQGPGAGRAGSDAAARRALEKAQHDAEQADAELARASRAVALAEGELERLKVAEAHARQRSKAAQERAVAAQKRHGGSRQAR